MLSLGIPIDLDDAENTIVELNIGGEFLARDFPSDSEFQLLAFRPSAKACEVVWVEELAKDIGEALTALEQTGFKRCKADWYRRLSLYCSGAKP